jgi:hypothetical protein
MFSRVGNKIIIRMIIIIPRIIHLALFLFFAILLLLKPEIKIFSFAFFCKKPAARIHQGISPKPERILRDYSLSNRGNFADFISLSFASKSDKMFALLSHSFLLNPFGFQLQELTEFPLPEISKCKAF